MPKKSLGTKFDIRPNINGIFEPYPPFQTMFSLRHEIPISNMMFRISPHAQNKILLHFSLWSYSVLVIEDVNDIWRKLSLCNLTVEKKNVKLPLCLVTRKFTPLEGNQSNLVQTAWSLMGLIHSGQVSL